MVDVGERMRSPCRTHSAKEKQTPSEGRFKSGCSKCLISEFGSPQVALCNVIFPDPSIVLCFGVYICMAFISHQLGIECPRYISHC